MNCKEWKRRFAEWKRTHWRDDEPELALPPELAPHVRTCASCRTAYEALSLLARGEVLNEAAPPFLASAIGATLTARAGAVRFRSFRFPRLVFPAFGASLVLLAFLLVFSLLTPASRTVTVKFRLEAPQAESVSVVGDWNEWNPSADRLTDHEGDGVWEIELTLTKDNEYRYQFIIDGESWIPDPHSGLKVEDGFGGINSVLEI